MIIQRLSYFIGKAFQNFRHFFVLNLITIGIISLSLLVLSTFLLAFLNLQSYLGKWKNQFQVTTYLADDITPEKLAVIEKEIGRIPGVKDLSYISKEEALVFFKDTFPDQKQVLEGLKENPLPASIDIQLQDTLQSPDQVKSFALQLKTIPGVDAVEYGQYWIEGYAGFLDFMKSAGLVVGAVVLLATVFIIANTIKLTVYARKEEIEIIRLVGATNYFIRTPFFIEGILQGLLGALTALGVLYIFYRLFVGWVAHLSYVPLRSLEVSYLPPHYVAFIIGGGMATGFLGSLFSLGRHLKSN